MSGKKTPLHTIELSVTPFDWKARVTQLFFVVIDIWSMLERDWSFPLGTLKLAHGPGSQGQHSKRL